MWFRPVFWEGAGEAFCLSYNGRVTEVVPSRAGGIVHMTTSVEALLGEWEAVTPDQVLAERE